MSNEIIKKKIGAGAILVQIVVVLSGIVSV